MSQNSWFPRSKSKQEKTCNKEQGFLKHHNCCWLADCRQYTATAQAGSNQNVTHRFVIAIILEYFVTFLKEILFDSMAGLYEALHHF